LYDALFDYYASRGDMPYGTMKAKTGDPFEWITDRLDQELGTGNHAPRSPNPVAEGSCNMTAEGEYCPEHGLAECGGMYEEENQFGPAATAAIQQGKSPTEVHYADSGDKLNAGFHNTMMKELDDPMNRNDAITNSFYESELSKLKKLALGK
jgi:hypothetical protein